MEHNATINLINACDGIALLVGLGIAARDEHDTNSSPLIESYLALIEIAFGHPLKEVHDITLQSQHDALCLRIAHAAVIFNDVWLGLGTGCVGAVDKSKEDKALVVNTFCSQSLYGRTDDAVFYLLHPFLCGKGDG